MKLMLDVDIKSPERQIAYGNSFFLIGSCFTEHIGRRLAELKFSVLQNPHGILFDPLSVSYSLDSYIDHKKYKEADLFFLNELWQSWNHHSLFSGTDAAEVLTVINHSQTKAHEHLKSASWLVITLGSSYSYRLIDGGAGVANCHRAPSQWFRKHLLDIGETVTALTSTIDKLKTFNTSLQIIFTISPVRHIRDGVIENNRSKARLIEAVHQLTEKYDNTYYFPAYEIVIDILRDYRFYDIDLVHPNYAATEIVFERFAQAYIEETTRMMMKEVRRIINAVKHKPFHPHTAAHQSFVQSTIDKMLSLQAGLPDIDFSTEIGLLNKQISI